MVDVFTTTAQISNLVATAYNREVDLALHAQPLFRQSIDAKKPTAQAMPGSVVTFSIGQDLAVATSTLTEATDILVVGTPNPTQVSVTLNEYGNGEDWTIKVQKLSFAGVDPLIARDVAFNMLNSIDKVVQGVLDTSANIIGVNGGTTKITGFAEASVAATDIFNTKVARSVVTKLRGTNVLPIDATYHAYVHPDVSADLQSESGAGGWQLPHQYQDTQNIYRGEIGTYLGASYMETPRCTIVTDGVGGTVPVYRSYFLGSQALAEVVAVEPTIVVGPQTDRLRRFFPLGWYALAGWSLYRTPAMWVARTASAEAAL